jgi:hypothetical protein
MPWEVIMPSESIEKATSRLPMQEMIERSDRTVIPEYVWEPAFKIREPVYNFEELMLISRTHWVLKQVFFAVIREALSPGYDLESAWSAKCPDCGKEYNYWPKSGKCDAYDEENKKCGAKLKRPNNDQWKQADQLLKKPCKDFTFFEVTKASIWYDLSLANYWLTVNYKHVEDPSKAGTYYRTPAEIEVQDPRYFRVVADSKGRLGDPRQLFCPHCWVPDMVYSPPETRCPKCGMEMKPTAYVQRVGGAIKARFVEEEVFHGSSDRLPPNLYGESRIICLWKILMSMMSMDDYNIEIYTEGKLGSIVNFPGHDQEEVNEIMDTFEQESLRKRVYDPILRRFRTSKKVRTLMIGSKEPVVVTKVMEDFKSMQSIEFYKYWKSAVQAVYSVMPILTGDQMGGARGGGTNPMVQITVQDRAIREVQKGWEDMINNKIFPAFGITDWKLKFNTMELRDEVRHAQVGQIKANTALTWLNAGFEVRISDKGDIEVSGEGKLQSLPSGGNPKAPQTENVGIDSPATGDIRERTGRFSPKPAGEQAENYAKSATIKKSEDTEIMRWINPNKIRPWEDEPDISRRY